MLLAYKEFGGRLHLIDKDEPLSAALWIDLFRPTEAEVAAVAAFGIEVPTLEDMEEIEVSNRLYRDDGTDYLTVIMTAHHQNEEGLTAPVTFILHHGRLVTVRHEKSRPFETYPMRADKVGPGCGDANRIFLSLVEECIGRLADHLESVGRALDEVARAAYQPTKARQKQAALEDGLRRVGRSGEFLGMIRLALLTLNRALGFYAQTSKDRQGDEGLGKVVTQLAKDLIDLEVHSDFLSGRVQLASDAALGIINLEQTATTRIVSVVAVLFLPPTLIASVYGMNFHVMPELDQPWGYPAALGLMVGSALGAWGWLKWHNWL
jgi:magnesium transporter